MPRKKTETAIAYRVVKHSCWHRGVEYKIGDILPPMSLLELNTHLINLEMVEVQEAIEEMPEPEPETDV